MPPDDSTAWNSPSHGRLSWRSTWLACFTSSARFSAAQPPVSEASQDALAGTAVRSVPPALPSRRPGWLSVVVMAAHQDQHRQRRNQHTQPQPRKGLAAAGNRAAGMASAITRSSAMAKRPSCSGASPRLVAGPEGSAWNCQGSISGSAASPKRGRPHEHVIRHRLGDRPERPPARESVRSSSRQSLLDPQAAHAQPAPLLQQGKAQACPVQAAQTRHCAAADDARQPLYAAIRWGWTDLSATPAP